VLDGADVVVGELLGGDVENLEVLAVLLDEMPSPTLPWRKSGLKVRAGASATALAAAWANWLFAPTTNEAKVLRGLSVPRESYAAIGDAAAARTVARGRGASALIAGAPSGDPAAAGTAKEIVTGTPSTLAAALFSCGR
jgi:hypothetical protein